MDFQKLKESLEAIQNHPKVKEKLEQMRSKDPDQRRKLLENFGSVVTALGLVASLAGGKKARQLEFILGIIVVLVELAILFKSEVIDDPDVRARVNRAWEELREESATLYVAAKDYVQKTIDRAK